MPRKLCAEGPDRDRLVADIRATYGERTNITSVTPIRQGGLFGFFAREIVRITFEPSDVDGDGDGGAGAAANERATEYGPNLVDLKTVAPRSARTKTTARERDVRRDAHRDVRRDVHRDVRRAVQDEDADLDVIASLLMQADDADGPAFREADNSQDNGFAALLGRLASAAPASDLSSNGTASTGTQAHGTLANETPPLAVVPEQPSLYAPSMVGLSSQPPAAERTVLSRPGTDARTRLEMLSGLRAVGVPIGTSPKQGETSLYGAIEQIVAELPTPAPLPDKAGDVLVVVGAPDQVEAALGTVAARMHLGADALWHSGAPLDATDDHAISGPMDAAAKLPQLQRGVTPVVVGVGLEFERGSGRFGWAAQLIAALRPTTVWAAVDAGRKVEDLRAELAPLGRIDALIVSGATRTTSPATVWDLEIPVALVDGRPATAGAWSGLLFDALRAGD